MFNVILCDPPWHFTTWSPKGAGRSPEYPTLTLDQLKALPVGSLAAPDCALFLWCCWPSILRDVPGVLAAWGFEYRTLAFMWVKANKSGAGFFQGLGYYTRANSEPCLLAIRGRMPVAAHNVQQVIYSPVRRHSQNGIVDIRGNAQVYGTIISMFDTSSYSSGYVSNIGATTKDGGSETVEAGDIGTIDITPDPDKLLPSGITTPIIIKPIQDTYTEG